MWFVKAVLPVQKKAVMNSSYDVFDPEYSCSDTNVREALATLDSVDATTYGTKYQEYLFRYVCMYGCITCIHQINLNKKFNFNAARTAGRGRP